MVLPDLWRGIVWRARLRIKQALLGNFGYVKVTELACTVSIKKDIGRLEITVKYFLFMENFQCTSHFYEHAPDLLLVYKLIRSLLLKNFLVKIAIVCKLHDEAE